MRGSSNPFLVVPKTPAGEVTLKRAKVKFVCKNVRSSFGYFIICESEAKISSVHLIPVVWTELIREDKPCYQ